MNSEDFDPEIPDLDVSLGPTLGKGHFSTVRLGRLLNGTLVAVKQFWKFDKELLVKEVSVLKAVSNHSHVLKLFGFTKRESSLMFVYSFHNSTRPIPELSRSDFRWWLKTMLQTLAELHEAGVMHRDVKVGNILADFSQRSLALIDFGFADFYRAELPKNPRVGSIRAKAPELAIGNEFYDCSVDIWSLGIACLDLLIGFRKKWDAPTTVTLVDQLVRRFGSSEWNEFARKYNASFVRENVPIDISMTDGLEDGDIRDLVSRFLVLDPERRISAQEALTHPFFQHDDL
jgi:serine/threonine protein kinase